MKDLNRQWVPMAHPDFDNFEWPITSGHRVVGVSFVHVSFG